MTPGNPTEPQRRRDQRGRRGVAAAVAVARGHGVRVDEPVVLNDLFSLMVHLRPAPVVARVATCMPRLRTPIEPWLEREIAVTTYLSQQGAPVVTPSAELPPGPHTCDGFPITFWSYLEPDPDRAVTTADCSAMLVDLHACLRAYPGALPPLCGIDIAGGLAAIDRTNVHVGASGVDRLQAAAERLRPLWESPDVDVQPLHGDAHPGTLIPTRAGLVWIDFEDVCAGRSSGTLRR